MNQSSNSGNLLEISNESNSSNIAQIVSVGQMSNQNSDGTNVQSLIINQENRSQLQNQNIQETQLYIHVQQQQSNLIHNSNSNNQLEMQLQDRKQLNLDDITNDINELNDNNLNSDDNDQKKLDNEVNSLVNYNTNNSQLDKPSSTQMLQDQKKSNNSSLFYAISVVNISNSNMQDNMKNHPLVTNSNINQSDQKTIRPKYHLQCSYTQLQEQITQHSQNQIHFEKVILESDNSPLFVYDFQNHNIQIPLLKLKDNQNIRLKQPLSQLEIQEANCTVYRLIKPNQQIICKFGSVYYFNQFEFCLKKKNEDEVELTYSRVNVKKMSQLRRKSLRIQQFSLSINLSALVDEAQEWGFQFVIELTQQQLNNYNEYIIKKRNVDQSNKKYFSDDNQKKISKEFHQDGIWEKLPQISSIEVDNGSYYLTSTQYYFRFNNEESL